MQKQLISYCFVGRTSSVSPACWSHSRSPALLVSTSWVPCVRCVDCDLFVPFNRSAYSVLSVFGRAFCSLCISNLWFSENACVF